MEEVRKLIATHYNRENDVMRRAFLFSCFTGIRKCDIERLTYENVDFTSMTLRFNQKKIEWRSAHSGVTTPLNEHLMKLIGEPGENPKALIFPLNKDQRVIQRHLNSWMKAAGITKHITWHCARHSFAVNILNGGADIKTVSSLLGHASLKMTEKYLHGSGFPKAVRDRQPRRNSYLTPILHGFITTTYLSIRTAQPLETEVCAVAVFCRLRSKPNVNGL